MQFVGMLYPDYYWTVFMEGDSKLILAGHSGERLIIWIKKHPRLMRAMAATIPLTAWPVDSKTWGWWNKTVSRC